MNKSFFSPDVAIGDYISVYIKPSHREGKRRRERIDNRNNYPNYPITILIIRLKRLRFTLHWSNRAIFSAYYIPNKNPIHFTLSNRAIFCSYCSESSAYCTELRRLVRQNYFCFEGIKVRQPSCPRQQYINV